MKTAEFRSTIRSSSSDDLDPMSCIMVDELGHAQFMVLTEDGRWIPAEEW